MVNYENFKKIEALNVKICEKCDVKEWFLNVKSINVWNLWKDKLKCVFECTEIWKKEGVHW